MIGLIFSRDLLCCCVVPIPGEEDCLISEAADVPQPLLTIKEADMAATMDEGLQVPAKGPASKGKQKKITSDDVLRLQYETLQCKKETLQLKKG